MSKFWEFVERLDFKSSILNKDRISFNDKMMEMHKFYNFDDLKEFEKIYRDLNWKTSIKYRDYWLSDDNPLEVSDDGYSDLISSTIGLGIEFYKSLTEEKLKWMSDNNYYLENFGYFFHPLVEDEFKQEYIIKRRLHKIGKI